MLRVFKFANFAPSEDGETKVKGVDVIEELIGVKENWSEPEDSSFATKSTSE